MGLGGERVRVSKPEVGHRRGGKGAEVPLLAYGAMQSDAHLREKLLSILIRRVSTTEYQAVAPEMAQRCGVWKAAVSRKSQEASAEALRTLCERRVFSKTIPDRVLRAAASSAGPAEEAEPNGFKKGLAGEWAIDPEFLTPVGDSTAREWWPWIPVRSSTIGR